MRENTHPEYCEIEVTCSCGHKFVTRSALCKALHIEVCNKCHPFYTGKRTIVDTAGRVERFNNRFKSLTAAAGRQDNSATKVKAKSESKKSK